MDQQRKYQRGRDNLERFANDNAKMGSILVCISRGLFFSILFR